MSQLRLTTNSNKINFSQITLNIQLQTYWILSASVTKQWRFIYIIRIQWHLGKISRMIGTKCPDNDVVWTSFQSNPLGHSSTVPTSPWRESRLPLMGVRSVCLKALNKVLNCRADKQQNKQTDQPWVTGLPAGWTWKTRSQMPALLLLTKAPGKLCSVLQFIWIMTVSTFHLRRMNTY